VQGGAIAAASAAFVEALGKDLDRWSLWRQTSLLTADVNAKIWLAAKDNRNFKPVQQAAHQYVEAFLRDMSQLLHPMLPVTAARSVSTIFWSSAKIGLSPDSLAPGVASDLAERFLYLIARPTAAERPNAQEVSNVLWAMATMKHMMTKLCLSD